MPDELTGMLRFWFLPFGLAGILDFPRYGAPIIPTLHRGSALSSKRLCREMSQSPFVDLCP